AASALVAIENAKKAGRPFELALIDACMPGSDGFALVQELQHRPGSVRHIVMMLNQGNRSGEIERCEKLGVTAYLMKPINQSELFDTFVAVLCGEALLSGAVSEDAAAVVPHEGVRGLQILLTEDSLYNQKLALGVLGKRGHVVTIANNGREAVEAVRKRKFDLILMDIQMPEMDGLEATKIIRAREREASSVRTPIIAMTAQAMKGVREKCLAVGMDDYLVKPVRARELHETIERVLGGGIGFRVDREHERNGLPLDWSVALGVVDGDRELLREIIDAFLEECPRLMGELESAIAHADVSALRRAAHTVKGGLRTFGAGMAIDIAERLEQMGRSGRIEENAVELNSDLKRHVDQLVPELAAYAGSIAVPRE
ncbi:MAG: response regulator, partial [Planctomycetaceae bacterium]